jgi:hypothetical protein
MGTLGGVTVTVTNGQLSLQTVTLSTGNVGSYQVSGLAAPSTYTVTFSGPGLVSQTKQVSLNALPAASPNNIDATMVSANAALFGVVSASSPNTSGCTASGSTSKVSPATAINVTLSSSTATYSVTAATTGTVGAYEVDNVQPGTYTVTFSRLGSQPTTVIENLPSGMRVSLSPTLNAAAVICGVVFQTTGSALPGVTKTEANSLPAPQVEVQLFPANQFPSGQSQQVLSGNDGSFEFDNVSAPAGYIVQFDFPQGSAGQFTLSTDANPSQTDVVCNPTSVPPPTTTTVPPTTAPPTTGPPNTGPPNTAGQGAIRTQALITQTTSPPTTVNQWCLVNTSAG